MNIIRNVFNKHLNYARLTLYYIVKEKLRSQVNTEPNIWENNRVNKETTINWIKLENVYIISHVPTITL